MAIEFNGKFGNVNNSQVSGKKFDPEAKKNLAAKSPVFGNADKVDNKYFGEKTNLADDPKAIYSAMGLQLGNIVKDDEVTSQIKKVVGSGVMQRVAATSAKSVENITETADFAYDDILADDTSALFAMAGLKTPVGAPSLEDMQKTLNESPFVSALFS